MLDQNTDRMWYVIGAVLIGAAIIFGMSSFMPSAFASVGDMFGQTTGYISERMTGSGDTTPSEYEGSFVEVPLDGLIVPFKDVHVETDGKTYWIESDGVLHGGLQISHAALTKGARHRLSFDFQKTSGEVLTMGGHLHVGSDADVYIRGVRESGSWTHGNGNTYPNDTDVHHVMVEFTVDEVFRSNKNWNLYIQPNRTTNPSYYPPYTGIVSNIKLEVATPK